MQICSRAGPLIGDLNSSAGPLIGDQVGTGQVSGQKGAQLYDEDVKKQAQQLGLPGWE